MVKMAGGTPVFVPLRPNPPKDGKLMSSADWQLDPAELASKFSERTKAIVLNSPNNPLGKVTLLAMLGPGSCWGAAATFAVQH